MRTDDLIDRLSGVLEPVPPSQVLRVLAIGLGAGAVRVGAADDGDHRRSRTTWWTRWAAKPSG